MAKSVHQTNGFRERGRRPIPQPALSSVTQGVARHFVRVES